MPPLPADFSMSWEAYEQLTLDTLKQQLSFLLRRYLRSPSTNLAETIVTTIENIIRHPDISTDIQDLCCYRKLLFHWQVLT